MARTVSHNVQLCVEAKQSGWAGAAQCTTVCSDRTELLWLGGRLGWSWTVPVASSHRTKILWLGRRLGWGRTVYNCVFAQNRAALAVGAERLACTGCVCVRMQASIFFQGARHDRIATKMSLSHWTHLMGNAVSFSIDQFLQPHVIGQRNKSQSRWSLA